MEKASKELDYEKAQQPETELGFDSNTIISKDKSNNLDEADVISIYKNR